MEEKTVAQKKKGSWLTVLLDSVIRSRKTLRAIKEDPKWIWAVFAALLVVSFIFFTVVAVPLQQKAAMEVSEEQIKAVQEQMEKDLKEMPAEKRAEIEQNMPQFDEEGNIELPKGFGIIAIGFGLVSGVILLGIGWLIKAAFGLLASKFWGEKTSFVTMVSAMGLTYTPFIIKNFIQGLTMLVTGNFIQHQGLSSLVVTSNDHTVFMGNLLYAILSRIDIFVFWSLFLLFLALVICGGVSKKKAILLTIIYWIGIMVVGVIPALIVKVTVAGAVGL